jgi:uncharacterized protein (DUF697 family)
MAKVYALSFHSGGKLHELEANSPAEIASGWDLSLDSVKVYVNDDEAIVTQPLRDEDIVSFQKEKVSSGS